MVKSRLISRLALCATFFAFSAIALGAFTRLVDAGLGCPDWPGCYGHLIAPLSSTANPPLIVYKAWAEMIHRYFAGCLSFFSVCIVSLIWVKKEFRLRYNMILTIFLVFLIIYQIILGQWTVTLKLLPIIVTQHLLGGFLILSVLWLIYLSNCYQSRVSVAKKEKLLLPWAVVALIILFCQIVLGAWTSTNYASLSCPDFPFCVHDQPGLTLHFKEAFNVFPPRGLNYEGGVLSTAVRQTIQMTHRFGALIFTIYTVIFSILALSILNKSGDILKLICLILGLLSVQVCIGITNVIFQLPLITAISHNLIAVLLLLSIITLIFKLAT